MRVDIPKPGKYVVAVSGGVDSMVLLDILAREPSLVLIIAHIDHGIRPDSNEDLILVEYESNKRSLKFNKKLLKLGSNASEEKARNERYKFLNNLQKEHQADGIITAHHQDDLIETAILNMLRGTGRKGLTSILDNPKVIRPLINVPKKEIYQYALDNGIIWHEDSTNNDEKYLRNYIRKQIIPKLDDQQKQQFINSLNSTSKNNQEIDTLLVKQINENSSNTGISRTWFNSLPHDVASETMATWLRQNKLRDFDRSTIVRLVIAAKTSKNSKKHPIIKGANLVMSKDELALELAER